MSTASSQQCGQMGWDVCFFKELAVSGWLYNSLNGEEGSAAGQRQGSAELDGALLEGRPEERQASRSR